MPTLPTVVAVTATFTSTGVPTATLPTGHTTNDILVLVLQSSNETITPPAGYTRLGPQNGFGTPTIAAVTRMGIFWKRDGGGEVAPTIPDTGNHTFGFMFAIRGCPTTGDPFQFGGNNFKIVTSTSGSGPKSSTYIDNCLVIDIFGLSMDSTGQQGSALTNGDLTSLTEQLDDSTSDGTGGGLYMASGTKAAAGPVGATTVTWANTSIDLCSRIHFIPSNVTEPGSGARGPEIQIFTSGKADLDDTWVKPYGARTVFAQIMDGGGSGSGGNTTGTAEGGGGGGGGGYDEEWFMADDLAATVTVHAGKGATGPVALGGAGSAGQLSEFNKGGDGGLTSTYRNAGTGATAAITADGGNGGCGAGRGLTAKGASATRVTFDGTVGNNAALGARGAVGGSGTTASTQGSPAEWGGGGGESGSDTDAGVIANQNGWSVRGGGGGGGGRTNSNVGIGGTGGGSSTSSATQGAAGANSTKLPYGGGGGNGGGTNVNNGGDGGFPGGGGGGGGGNGTGLGGAGGDGCVVVTTYF